MNTITVIITLLPSFFNNEIISSCQGNYIIHSNITNLDLCDQWTCEFSDLTNTS